MIKYRRTSIPCWIRTVDSAVSGTSKWLLASTAMNEEPFEALASKPRRGWTGLETPAGGGRFVSDSRDINQQTDRMCRPVC